MSKYKIVGGHKLNGSVDVPRAKNAYLPILAGCILIGGEVVLRECPHFADIENMCKILNILGVKTTRQGDAILIDASNAKPKLVQVELAKTLRSSIFTLGAMLARFGTARVAYPGGCNIGLRPIDIHEKALKELGVSIIEEHGILNCNRSHFLGGEIYLDFASVGATENIIMCATLGDKKVTIHNCACEPEVVDLANFLNKAGAKIFGAGTPIIIIEGVKTLHSIEYTPIFDRIIAGTYAIATAICGGKVAINGVESKNISILLNKLCNSGCNFGQNGATIYMQAPERPISFGLISTAPFPGFATDLQAQMLTLATISQGVSIVRENVFEARLRFVPELIKMGADIRANNRVAVIRGVKHLSGAEVYAEDLRGGASLVLAGLSAEGYTIVNDIYHIDRGYPDMAETFGALGADIKREE